jgi:feruloyl esterase
VKLFTATAAALVCAGLVQTFNVGAAQPMACANLVQLDLGADVKIDSAVEMAEGTPLRSIVPTGSLAPTCSHDVVANTLRGFCRVQATIKPTKDSNIKIEVWLPLQGWNGKFQGYGNHGFAGNIDYVDLGPELNKGYAVAGTDTGHQGGGTGWMQVHEQIVDYGSRGIHEMAVKAKAITEAFYGTAPKYSYFNGCSTGGKEGLMAAQRYPEDFDGINIGGSANFDQIGNRVQYVWNGQVTFGRGVPLANTTARRTLDFINDAVVAACDEIDGIKDGVLDDPRECDFQPASLLCKAGQDPNTCLTALQVDALEKVYQGPRNPRTGEELYPGLVRGSERGWGGHTAGPNIFATADQFFKFMVYNNPAWDYRTFNFDSDFAFAKSGFSPLIDAVDPSLDAFRKRGGKLLFSHLWSSTTHAATKSIEYYEEVARRLHGGDNDNGYAFGKTQEFFRLFMVPSASGSKGPDTFDSMPLLEKWVEQGIPPKSILAVHKTSGVVDRTRIVCPYPQRAVWTGQGSTDDAANFVCRNKGKH